MKNQQSRSDMKNESKNAQKLHKGRAKIYELNDAYDKKFIDPRTGKHFSKYTRKQACPVCKSQKFIEIFTKDGGTYVKCPTCTHVYTNPVLTDAALVTYYQGAPAVHGLVADNESSFFREMYTLGLSKIAPFVKPGRVLDMGCSTGFFLDVAREKEWQTTGTELGIDASNIAKKKGHLIYTEPLEKITFEEKFDAITLWDVFEHIVDGAEHLKMFKKLLAPGGVVFIHTPNSDSFAVRAMRERSHTFCTGHVNLYNPRSIERLAKRMNYEILHLDTVISEAAVLENYLNYEDPYFGSTKFNGTVMGFITPEDIQKHRLGHKLHVVLRPKSTGK